MMKKQMENKLSQSLEDYLEIIYNEIKENTSVKAIDISRQLNVSRASVTEALNKLAEKGYINYEKYGEIIINELGLKKAKEIVSRHRELSTFLKNLGVDDNEAEDTACKIEHIISKNVQKRIAAFNKFCKQNPELKF